MNDQPQITYAQALIVKTSYEAELMQKANVVGVGIGVRQQNGQYTNEIAIVVMVERKLPITLLQPKDRLPTQIEGVAVDVQEIGRPEAHSDTR